MIYIFFEAVLAAWNITTARYQAEWIERHEADGKKFLHWPWTLAYAMATAVSIYFGGWWMIPLSILVRLVSFNPALNSFRDNPFFYVNKKDHKGSAEWIVYSRVNYEFIWAGAMVLLASLNIILLV